MKLLEEARVAVRPVAPADYNVIAAWLAVGGVGERWRGVSALEEDDAATVARWYVEAFEDVGWSRIDLGSPLEDGTQVLDLGTDLPECRVQVTFRPVDGSTMIIVLYGAGCGGAEG